MSSSFQAKQSMEHMFSQQSDLKHLSRKKKRVKQSQDTHNLNQFIPVSVKGKSNLVIQRKARTTVPNNLTIDMAHFQMAGCRQ